MSGRPIAVVPLPAAGTRPASAAFLQPILGRTPLRLVLDAVAAVRPARILVVARRGAASVPAAGQGPAVEIVTGRASSGPRAALRAALSALGESARADLLFVPADLPLVEGRALRALLAAHRRERNALTLLAAAGPGAGRGAGPGIAVLRGADLRAAIRGAAGGWAGIAARLARAGKKTGMLRVDPEAGFRLRGPADVGRAAAVLRRRKARDLARRGVVLLDPASAWIDLGVAIGRGTVVYPNAVLEGETRIGRECRVFPGAHVAGCLLGDRVKIFTASVLEGAILEDDVTVGPFARLRPGTILRRGCHVGNFVEMKKTDFGPGAKAGHLSYLGDSEVGAGANIGAGTITCNYDGVRKNRTRIGEGAFIGSGSELVAPVTVGRGAYVGAGSVITKDVEPGALAVARGRQVVKPGWVARRRAERAKG